MENCETERQIFSIIDLEGLLRISWKSEKITEMDILGPADGLQLDTVRGPGSSEQVAHVNMPPGHGRYRH